MSVLRLASRTPAGWARAVAADVPALLSDHAHCELKASASAQSMLRRHGTRPGLAARLTPLVREELEHYQRVRRELAARDEPLRPDRPSPYMRGLLAAAGSPRRRADGYLDSLLVAALIELRSHERFARMLECAQLAELHGLVGPLAQAEERHAEVFFELALQAFPGPVVRARFADLAAAEARVLQAAPCGPRVHSGCPAA